MARLLPAATLAHHASSTHYTVHYTVHHSLILTAITMSSTPMDLDDAAARSIPILDALSMREEDWDDDLDEDVDDTSDTYCFYGCSIKVVGLDDSSFTSATTHLSAIINDILAAPITILAQPEYGLTDFTMHARDWEVTKANKGNAGTQSAAVLRMSMEGHINGSIDERCLDIMMLRLKQNQHSLEMMYEELGTTVGRPWASSRLPALLPTGLPVKSLPRLLPNPPLEAVSSRQIYPSPIPGTSLSTRTPPSIPRQSRALSVPNDPCTWSQHAPESPARQQLAARSRSSPQTDF